MSSSLLLSSFFVVVCLLKLTKTISVESACLLSHHLSSIGEYIFQVLFLMCLPHQQLLTFSTFLCDCVHKVARPNVGLKSLWHQIDYRKQSRLNSEMVQSEMLTYSAAKYVTNLKAKIISKYIASLQIRLFKDLMPEMQVVRLLSISFSHGKGWLVGATSQPLGVISGLKTNSTPSLSYCAHKSLTPTTIFLWHT